MQASDSSNSSNFSDVSNASASSDSSNYFKKIFRTVRDWPKPGVNFRDITPLFLDPAAFSRAIEVFAEDSDKRPFDVVAAVDARGFAIGGALACRLRKPFVLVRKKGKLPFKTISESYQLEYGSAAVEVHIDACKPGDRVLIVDDLIATGGTLLAVAKLFRALGATVVGVSALIDLVDLGGSKKLRAEGLDVHVLCEFTETG